MNKLVIIIKTDTRRKKKMKRVNENERWRITEAGEAYLALQRKTQPVYIPVYRNKERTDGKPSINTPEGWEALRQRIEQERIKKTEE